MDGKLLQELPRRLDGARSEGAIAPPAPAAPTLRATWVLSAMVAVLTIATPAAGLWAHGLYRGAPWASAALRGGDLVTLVVAAPALIGALLLARRGSRRAELVWAGTLAYAVDTYAFFVFGAAFNDVFLLHVALFSLSLFALALTLANLDVTGIGARFVRRTPARSISTFLLLVAAGLGGMWSFFSLRFAATGRLPEGIMPASGVHLVYTLDLALVVPSLALAAVLLWRQTAWGYVLGAVLSIYGLICQLNFMAASVFQANAHVAGAAAFDPLELPLVAGFLASAALLLWNLRRGGAAVDGPRWGGTHASDLPGGPVRASR
jgi:hypothetical protein